jgi:hypothetical protein
MRGPAQAGPFHFRRATIVPAVSGRRADATAGARTLPDIAHRDVVRLRVARRMKSSLGAARRKTPATATASGRYRTRKEGA